MNAQRVFQSLPEVTESIQVTLKKCGFPDEIALSGGAPAFAAYVSANPGVIPAFIKAVFARKSATATPTGVDDDALQWVGWAFCGGEPMSKLAEALKGSERVAGTCGLVWGRDDIAYRCKTCEMDPTCAICVNCFLNGDHTGHDYAMIRTGGGCCDCGDPTAWKPTGFCRMHAGPQEAPPLPVSFLTTAVPTLKSLLAEWVDQMSQLQPIRQPSLQQQAAQRRVDLFTTSVSEWLLHICNFSNALIRLVAEHMGSEGLGLLDVLMQNDGLLSAGVAKGVHTLLYKLLGDPFFKHQLAITFVRRYPSFLNSHRRMEVVGLGGASSILDSFSVQIFTVPALVARLAREAELLCVLLETLSSVLKEAWGGNSTLQAESKVLEQRHYWRVSDDLRYVLSHVEAAHWMVWERPHLLGMWLRLLHSVQGMTPHTRLTAVHVEMESESWSHGYLLETQLVAIHPLLVAGILFEPGSQQQQQQQQAMAAAPSFPQEPGSPAGRRSAGALQSLQEMGVRTAGGAVPSGDDGDGGGGGVQDGARHGPQVQVPASLEATRGEWGEEIPQPYLQMLVTCVDSLATWLARDFKEHRRKIALKLPPGGSVVEAGRGDGGAGGGGMDMDVAGGGGGGGGGLLGGPETQATDLKPPAGYDVASGDAGVSFHLPLHRLLALLVQGVAHRGTVPLARLLPASMSSPGVVRGLLEHPLRLQVLNAQVRAGMWRRNGRGVAALTELYTSVHWCEDSLDLDMFLMQACAVLGPPEAFAAQALERFGLAGYFTEDATGGGALVGEAEPALAEEMLRLLARIGAERGLCGQSEEAAVRRELVQRLAAGDTTHSALLRALPRRLSDHPHLPGALKDVSTYRTPSGLEQGRYALKQECWRELELHHPRWSRRELQQAEERYQGACKAPAATQQLPRWSPPYPTMAGLHRALISGITVGVVRSVVLHAAYRSPRAPDDVLLAALQLLALMVDAAEHAGEAGGGGELWERACESADVTVPDQGQEAGGQWGRQGGAKPGPPVRRPHSLVTLLALLQASCGASSVGAGAGDGGLEKRLAECAGGLLGRFTRAHEGCRSAVEAVTRKEAKDGEGGGGGGAEGEEDELERRKREGRERQAAAMARMRAQQQTFMMQGLSDSDEDDDADDEEGDAGAAEAAAAAAARVSGCALVGAPPGGGDEAEGAARRNLLLGGDEPECAHCRDSTARSPLGYIALSQRSAVLQLAAEGARAWSHGAGPQGQEGVACASPAAASPGMEGQPSLSSYQPPDRPTAPSGSNESLVRMLGGTNIGSPSFSGGAVDPGTPEANSARGGGGGAAVIMDSDDEDEVTGGGGVMVMAAGAVEGSLGPLLLLRPGDQEGGEGGGGADGGGEGAAEGGGAGWAGGARGAGAEAGGGGGARVPGRRGSSAPGVHISACGHMMHADCQESYLTSLRVRHSARTTYEGVNVIDLDMNEFLCPVCRRLANCLLPIVPDAATPVVPERLEPPGRSHGSTGSDTMVDADLPWGGEDVSSTPMDSEGGVTPGVTPGSTPRASAGEEKGIGGARRGCGAAALQVYTLAQAELVVHDAVGVRGGGGGGAAEAPAPSAAADPLQHALGTFAGTLWRVHNGAVPEAREEGTVPVLWEAVRCTVAHAELVSRDSMASGGDDGAGGAGAMGMPASLQRLLAAGSPEQGSVLPVLARAAGTLRWESPATRRMRAAVLRSLLPMLLGLPPDAPFPGEKALPQPLAGALGQPVLAQDLLGSLVALVFAAGPASMRTPADFDAAARLVYLAHVLQVLVAAGAYGGAPPRWLRSAAAACPLAALALAVVYVPAAAAAESEQVAALLSQALRAAPQDPASVPASATGRVRRLVLPFLRRCVLLRAVLFGADQCAPPAGFPASSFVGGWYAEIEDGGSQIAEARLLEGVLGLPPAEEILSLRLPGDEPVPWAHAWAARLVVEAGVRGRAAAAGGAGAGAPRPAPVSVPRPVTAQPFRLLQLPHSFHALFQVYVAARCARCRTVPQHPALCLLCGQLVCVASPCCSEHGAGECYLHAARCAAGIGVFLLLKNSSVLLLREQRRSFWGSPYLDAHGEEDMDLRRGKPLYLSAERYSALNAMVASCGMDHNSAVLDMTSHRDGLFY